MTISVPKRRLLFRGGVAVAVALFMGALIYALVELGTASRQLERQSKVVSALSVGLSDAQSQLKQNGIAPKQPPPAQIIAQAGPPGAVGPQGPGPSDAQVETAVVAYLTAHPIPAGPAGPAPSTDVVAAAVTAYLKANPAPVGPVGPTGVQGPGPSDQQIADAVATYLAANPPPAGPQGPAGPAGPSGAAGASGAPGAPGKDGSPGPAPAGWTFTMAGVTYDCAPDSQQPAPHYTCTPQPSPTPTPLSTAPSGTAPAAKRHTATHAAGEPSRPTRSWPTLLLSAVLVWPPEKRSAVL